MDNNYNNTPNDNQSGNDQGYNDPNQGYQDPNQGYQDPNQGYQNPNQGYQNQNQGYQNQNQGYQQDQYNYQNQGGYGGNQDPMMDSSPMSMKDWVITMILASIPCLNFVMLIVWAVAKTGNINRRNFARAYLIIQVVIVVLYFILATVFGATFAGIMNSYY